MNLSFSKSVICPNCFGKLCKIDTIDNGFRIHFKHKGCELLIKEAVIKCVHCHKFYVITALDGIVKEVNFGNDINNE